MTIPRPRSSEESRVEPVDASCHLSMLVLEILSTFPEQERGPVGHALRLVLDAMVSRKTPVARTTDSKEYLEALAAFFEVRMVRPLREAAESAPNEPHVFTEDLRQVAEAVRGRVASVTVRGFPATQVRLRGEDLAAHGFTPFEHTPHETQPLLTRQRCRVRAVRGFLEKCGLSALLNDRL